MIAYVYNLPPWNIYIYNNKKNISLYDCIDCTDNTDYRVRYIISEDNVNVIFPTA